MIFVEYMKRFWNFLNEDSWQSWIVSLILAFVIIKFIFFPFMSFVTGTSLPLVVVESCSMYHESSFDEWWIKNSPWYARRDINRTDFDDFPFRNGLNKGDIVLVYGRGNYSLGDVIIFASDFQHPLIHRIVSEDPLGTKGDHNTAQLPQENSIQSEAVLGKAVARVPLLGWIKLIFFEGSKAQNQRGLCK